MEAFIETQKPKLARLERQTDEALALNVVGAAHLMGICRSTVFAEIAAGRLKARKAGRRTLILRSDIDEWLSSLPVRSASAA